MSERRPPLPGRLVGYVLAVVVVAGAARLVWALLEPLMPVLVTLLVLAGIYWLLLRRVRW